MGKYKFTQYFKNEALRKRPYLSKKICIKALENHLKVERQEDNRFRFWGKIEELGNKS